MSAHSFSSRVLAVVVFCCLSTSVFAQATCGESWVPGLSPHGGPNGAVDVVKTLDIGAGPQLFILAAGANPFYAGFTTIAEAPAACVARFDGSVWSPIGVDSLAAVSLKWGRAMTAFDDGTGAGPRLYVAGSFAVPGIAAWQESVGRWDGAGWTLLGLPANGLTRALTVFDEGGTGPRLIVGGQFTSIGGVAANAVARWTGTAWTPMGALTNGLGNVTAFQEFGVGAAARLHAAAYFLPAVAVPGSALVQWTGAAWVPVGPPGLQAVQVMCVHQEGTGSPQLFVAGFFAPFSFGLTYMDLAKWDGTNWSAVGTFSPVANGSIRSMLSFNDGTGSALHIIGAFSQVQPAGWTSYMVAWRYARYQNNALTVVPYPSTATIHPLARSLTTFSFGGVTRLVSAGHYDLTETSQTSFPPSYTNPDYVAQWDGTNWLPVGSGSWYRRRGASMVEFDDGSGSKLYVGGQFPSLGGAIVNGLGRWNGTAWEAVGAPVVAALYGPRRLDVTHLAVLDDGAGPRLYLAGTAQWLDYVFRWDGGSSFTQLGPSFPSGSRVTSMTAWDDGAGPALWIGLDFGDLPSATYAGLSSLRAWRNNAWQTLSQLGGPVGPDGPVSQLLVEPNGGLLLGGKFSAIGQAAVVNVARLLPGYAVNTLFSQTATAIVPGTKILDLALYDDSVAGRRLFALSFVTTGPAAGSTIGYVSRYDATGWTAIRTIPQLVAGTLRTVPYLGGEALLLGAKFQAASGPATYSLERLTSAWSTFPVDRLMYDARFHGDSTFVSGDFDVVGGIPSGSVAALKATWPTIATQPGSKTVGLGQPVSFVAAAGGPPPLAYEWFRNGVTSGVTTPTYSIASATFADSATYQVTVTNACGSVTSLPAILAVRGCDLGLTQPFGLGIIAATLSGGVPFSHGFTAFSVAPENATDPGAGSVFGLHMAFSDAVAQFITQSPPFVSTLGPAGSSFWASPVPAALIGVRLWGVSTLYDPTTLVTIGAPSAIADRVLQ